MAKRIYLLRLNDRAFSAINARKKRVEIRANTKTPVDYASIAPGNYIVFYNSAGRRLACRTRRNTLYVSVRALLEAEGTEHTLSSTDDLEQGIRSIESIADYKQTIPLFGVRAIELAPCGAFLSAFVFLRAFWRKTFLSGARLQSEL